MTTQIIHDCATGEITEVSLTKAEIDANAKAWADHQAGIEAAKAARQAVLDKLGLTAEEAAALL